MTTKSVNQWCRTILPRKYREVDGQTAAIQAFLNESLPDPINKLVTVINSTEQEVVIAVADAQISNYLRLHSHELQQQIHETFNTSQTLKIKTMPASKLAIDKPPLPKKPEPVSTETIKAIQRNANATEDENLKQALLSLANSLKSR